MKGPIRQLISVCKEDIELQASMEMEEMSKTLNRLLSNYSISQLSDSIGVNKTRLYNFLNNKPNNALQVKELCRLNSLIRQLTSIQ